MTKVNKAIKKLQQSPLKDTLDQRKVGKKSTANTVNTMQRLRKADAPVPKKKSSQER